ncbi:hypothetical protein ACFVTX_07485 [Agromyces sp. NPDC058136]|uniref:hypothetical protein n=1 Tax=Agromyces sp. NPDC058136 TaxID=3346354 RepID=UPI0036DF9DFF
MDWLDDAVRQAAPPSLGADATTAELARATARAVVDTTPRRAGFARRLFAGFAIGAGALSVGVTAAVAAPAVADWLGWTPDVVAERSFELPDGIDLGSCEVFIRVAPDYQDPEVPVAEVDRRVESARAFLAEHDWDPLLAAITAEEIEAAYLEEVERRTAFTDPDSIASGETPPPATYSMTATQLMSDRIGAEFERAGHLEPGVSLEGAAEPCSGASEGAAQ